MDKSREARKVLRYNGLKGLIMGNQKRVGTANNSGSVEDINKTKNIPMVTRQASIIAGLNVGLTTASGISDLTDDFVESEKVDK
jgi:hypothetical protein